MHKTRLLAVLAVLAGVIALLGAAPATAATVGTTPAPTPSFNRMVTSMARVGNVLYVGGHFSTVTGIDGTVYSRPKAAAIDLSTREVLPWSPVVRGGGVLSVAAGSGGVYLGGDFTSVGGQPAGGLVKVDRETGAVRGLRRHDFNAPVRTIALSSNRIYVGGDFTRVGSVRRTRLAALARNGVARLLPWAPRAAGGEVRDLVVRSWGVYVAGGFTSLNRRTRDARLALVRLGTGATKLAFNPSPRGRVFELALAARRVHAAVGGVGGSVAAYRRYTGTSVWSRFVNGDAQTLVVAGRVVYVGGHFTRARPPGSTTLVPRARLAAYRLDGRLLAWNPGADSAYGLAAMLALPGTRLALGGTFDHVADRPRSKFAILGP